VKIISVERLDEKVKEAVSRISWNLENTCSKELHGAVAECARPGRGVLIFDSADGGMIAATLTALQQWRADTNARKVGEISAILVVLLQTLCHE